MREIPCPLSDEMLSIQREHMLALSTDPYVIPEVRQAAITLANYYGTVLDYRAWDKADNIRRVREVWSTCVYGDDCSYCNGG